MLHRGTDFQTHRRLHHRVAVGSQNVDCAVESIVKELFVDVEDGRIFLARFVVGRIVQHPEHLVAVDVEIRDKLGLAEALCFQLRFESVRRRTFFELNISCIKVRGSITSPEWKTKVRPSFERRKPE